jgi:hypothetical protein
MGVFEEEDEEEGWEEVVDRPTNRLRVVLGGAAAGLGSVLVSILP